MIFENLSDRLQGIFKKMRGHGKLTEDDVNDAMREVRMALLEADVNFKVVKDFVKRVKERAIGQEVLDTLTAAQAGRRAGSISAQTRRRSSCSLVSKARVRRPQRASSPSC